MKKFFKIFLEVVLGLALLAGALVVMRSCKREQGEAQAQAAGGGPRAHKVAVAAAELRRTSDKLDALGNGEAKESVEITASESEKVVGIFFTDGQAVEEGDLLVQLEERLLQAERKSAVAALEEDEREVQRLSTLLKKDAIAEKELDSRKTALVKAQSALEAIDVRLALREIRAPFKGVLGLRRVSLGAYVAPGTVVTTLDDISQIHVDFMVPEKYLVTLTPGMTFLMRTPAFPGNMITGVVTTVETRIDPVTRSAVVRGTVDNPERRLRPGMLFTVALESTPRETLWVPEKALMSLGEIQFVYVPQNDGTVARREIRLGRREGGSMEVLEGLAEGELVVTDGVGKLQDGDAVDIVNGKETASHDDL